MDNLSNQEYDEEYRSKMKEIIDRAAKITLALKDTDLTTSHHRSRLGRSLSTSTNRRKSTSHDYHNDYSGYDFENSDEERLKRKPSRRRSLSRRRRQSTPDTNEWKFSRQTNPVGPDPFFQPTPVHPTAHHHAKEKGFDPQNPFHHQHFPVHGYGPHPPEWELPQHQPEYLDENSMLSYFGPPPGMMHHNMLSHQPPLPPPPVPPHQHHHPHRRQSGPVHDMMPPPPPPPPPPELYDYPMHPQSHASVEALGMDPRQMHQPPPAGGGGMGMAPIHLPHPMHAMMMEAGGMPTPMMGPSLLPHQAMGLPDLQGSDPGMDNTPSPPQMWHSGRMRHPSLDNGDWKWCFMTMTDNNEEEWTPLDDNNQMLLQDAGFNDGVAYEIMDSHIEGGRKRVMVFPQRQYCFYHLGGQMIKLPIALRNISQSDVPAANGVGANAFTGTPGGPLHH